jgi:hypothetical protein
MSNTTTGTAVAQPRLDDLMLAMDVVDTLRHEERLVEKELAQGDRDEALKKRLREIYEGQGLQVNDRILEEGIKALKESRFVYKRSGSAFGRFWANLWVNRKITGSALGLVLAVLLVWFGAGVWSGIQEQRARTAANVEITQTLPKLLADEKATTLSQARTDGARAAIEKLAGDGEAAIARRDATATRDVIKSMQDLRARIVQEYELRIVSARGETTGFFRTPNINRDARNYYIVVEAVSPSGQKLTVPIRSEEDNATANVSKFAVRVPQATYDEVSRDKRDDGIIQNNVLGRKTRGAIEPTWSMPAIGAYLTKW